MSLSARTASFTIALTALVAGFVAPTASARSFAQPPVVPSIESAPAHVDDVASLRIAPPVIDRAALRARLAANRAANLERFRRYRLAGVYPDNVFTRASANVWRDQQGNFCAAATIIRASGELALVEQIAEDDNFIRLADVTQGPVMDWILTSGLTQAELVMIQKPFRPVTQRPELAPGKPIAVNARMRAAETRRLARLYRQIETRLAHKSQASLDAAVERLLAQPALAAELLAS